MKTVNPKNVLNDLNKYKNMDFKDVDKNKMKDIDMIKINTKDSTENRILDFIKKNKNPYFIKVDNHLIKMTFNSSLDEPEEILSRVIKENYTNIGE